ncbi:MAG: hypothetical protein U0525_04925 [Patescibacteria group bacterium]
MLLFGQFGRATFNGGFNIYYLEVVIAVHTGIIFLVNYSSSGKKYLHEIYTKSNQLANRIFLLWLVFVTIVVLMGVHDSTLRDDFRAISYILRILNFYLFTFLVVSKLANIKLDGAMKVLSYALPITALLQYIFIPDLRFLVSFGWDPHMYRAVGTIFDPPIMGSLLGSLFVYKSIKIIKYRSGSNNINLTAKLRNIVFSNIDLMLLYLSIIFLYSRSTYLAVFIASTYLLIINKKYLFVFCFIILFIFSIYLAPLTIPSYKQLESAKIERISTVTTRKRQKY